MAGLAVDPGPAHRRAGPGLTLAQFDAAAAHGLATPLGACLHDRHRRAHARRRPRLAQRPLRPGLRQPAEAVDMVTADGRRCCTSDRAAHDLFWAVRGGGGNFGVVISFSYRLHPVTRCSPEQSPTRGRRARGLRGYDELAVAAPDELTTGVSVVSTRPVSPWSLMAVCWSGARRGRRVGRASLPRAGAPIRTTRSTDPYVALQRPPTPVSPRDVSTTGRPASSALPDEAIEIVLGHLAQTPSPYTGIGLQQMTRRGQPGAPPRPPSPPGRPVRLPDPVPVGRTCRLAGQRRLDTRPVRGACSPTSSPRLHEQPRRRGPGRVRAAYGTNYDRLVEVQGEYDPENVFRLNHNIAAAPAQAGG